VCGRITAAIAGRGGDEVDAQHRRPLAHPAGDEAVAEVVGVADERALAARQADGAHDDQVVQRDRQHDQRREHRVPAGAEVLAGAEERRAHGQDAQQQADHQAAAVAHEDARGREVEAQEAE
jgi:hypothetical protein